MQSITRGAAPARVLPSGPHAIRIGTTLGVLTCILVQGCATESPSSPPEASRWQPAGVTALLEHAQASHSSALLIIDDGEVVVEAYWEVDVTALPLLPRILFHSLRAGQSAQGHPREDVASVQKSVIALLTLMAEERGHLSLDDPIGAYLGPGWSHLPPERESEILVRHLLSMSSGLDEALAREGAPGSVWRYNNPAYHLMHPVLEAATGLDGNTLLTSWLGTPLGLTETEWVTRSNGEEGLVSTARDLARIGALVHDGGVVGGTRLLEEATLARALQSSQEPNPAYGLLWWLNGKGSWIEPNGATRAGPMAPQAPADLVMALGALDRSLAVSRAEGLILVRMGAASAIGTGPESLDELWRQVMLARGP